MKSIVTRWIALVLALVMCVGVLPIGALAEGEEEPEVTDPAEPVADSDGGEEPDEPAEPDDVGEPQDPYEVYDQTTDTDAPEDGDAEPEVMQDGEYAPSAESEEPQAAAANEPADTDANEGEGEDGEEEDTRVVTDEGLRIERLAARVAFGAVENEKGDWVWTPLNDWNGHDFAYRVTYSFGSTEMFMPEEIEFFIPKSIIRNIRGEKSDLYEMSIPHKDAEGLTNTNVYVYEEVGDQIRVFNRVPALATQKGYFEISYVTAEKTYEYMDYDEEAPVGSAPFTVTMNLRQPGAEKSSEAEAPRVYIDTTAYISRIIKTQRNTMPYTEWQSSWGEAPENPDDYYYLIWEIHSYITANQAYNFSLNDVFDIEDGEVVGYKLQGESTYSDKTTLENLKIDYSAYGRYDYVLTRHLKSTYDHYLYEAPTPDEATYSTGSYTIENKVDGTVTPACLVDAPTMKSASCPWTHRVHKYTPPGGHFWSEKWGLDYKSSIVTSSNNISKYNLSEFIAGEIDEISGLRYSMYIDGYPYPWTWYNDEYDGTGWVGQDSEEGRKFYGKRPVYYSLSDSELWLETMDGSAKANLEPGDYRIDSLSIDYRMYEGLYDEEAKSFKAGAPAFSEIEVYVKIDDENYELVATLGSDGWTVNDENIVLSAEGQTVTFKNETGEVTGFRVETSNAFYYTRVSIRSSVTLKNTDTVMSIANAAQESGQLKILLGNHSDSNVYHYYHYSIFSKHDTGVDYIIGVDQEGHIEKSLIGHKNNVLKRCYSITWQCSASESYLKDGDIREYIEQRSGTFYDLVPSGGEFTPGSVCAFADGKELKSGEFKVRTILNYKDTGRTLLIVEMKVPANEYYFIYKTEHSWDAI
ncbi:MAG: hypothetical protein II583_04555, partial [Oscillospiraceae bacterium]|nr:hypothetical protein [Oscillospiraceae bacterium]